MGSQIAKLYLRGELVTKTLHNLSPDQRDEIEGIINQVVEDPMLQHCRREFCNALKRTIKNEYADTDVGEADYQVAIMRAAVAAKYGYGKHKPTARTLTDPIQRKKWFQTWAFNYLRQILRENKIPAIAKAERRTCSADQALFHLVGDVIHGIIREERDVPHRRLLRSLWERAQTKDFDSGFTILFDHWSFPLELVKRLQELNAKYVNYCVQIIQTTDGIEIRRMAETVPEITITLRSSALIKETSFDSSDEEGEESRRDQLEMEVMDRQDGVPDIIDDEDPTVKLKKTLSIDAQKVLDLMVEDFRPDDYTEKYGLGNAKVAHMSEYLDKSPKEIKILVKTIKANAIALGLGVNR